MKKTYLWILVSFVLLFVAVSCVKDSLERTEEKEIGGLSLDEARLYFEGFLSEFEVFPFTTERTRSGRQDEAPVITPLWEKGRKFLLNGVPTIESPYNINSLSIRPASDSLHNDKPLKDRLNARYRLVMQTALDGDISFYTAVLIATDEYLKTDKLSRLTMNNLQNFSGRIMYYDIKGDFVGGLIFDAGRQAGTVKPLTGAIDPSLLPASRTEPATRAHWVSDYQCYTEYEVVENCWYTGYYNNEGWNETHVQCFYDYYPYEVCYDYGYWVDDDPPTGGGSGGGGQTGQTSWDSKSKRFVLDPSKTYKFALNKTAEQLQLYIRDQVFGKTCALHSMAYVTAQLGTTTVSVSTFERAYINYEYTQTGQTVYDPYHNGVNITHVSGLIDQLFTTMPFTNFDDALSKGYVIISIQDINGGESHTVTVIGKTGDSLIYADSAYGELREIRESDLGAMDFQKVITNGH